MEAWCRDYPAGYITVKGLISNRKLDLIGKGLETCIERRNVRNGLGLILMKFCKFYTEAKILNIFRKNNDDLVPQYFLLKLVTLTCDFGGQFCY